jgi:mono/diheme cytochrome c family protein
MILGITSLLLSIAWAGDKPQGKSNTAVYGPLAAVPDSAQIRKNPFAGSSRDLAAGKKLFEQHCEECHGTNADGTRHAPSLITEEVQQAPPGALFWILTNGIVRQGMPVWSKLPEPQRWQIITFVQSLNKHSGGTDKLGADK